MEKTRGFVARIGLAEYLTGLQAELSKACTQAVLEDLKFSVDGGTLELDISFTLTESAESPTTTKPEYWVIGSTVQEAKDDAGTTHRDMQHLIVRLASRPEAIDTEGLEEVPAIMPKLLRTRLPEAE